MNPFRLQFHIRSLVKFTVIFSLFLALYHWSGVDRVASGPGGTETMLWLVGMAFIGSLTFMIPKTTVPRCVNCGRDCLPTWNAKPQAVCHSCRVSKMAPDQRRSIARWWLIFVACLCLVLAYMMVGPFAQLLRIRLDWPGQAWIGVAVFVAIFLFFLGAAIVRLLLETVLMGKPVYALRVARKCAGEHVIGDETSIGRITVHALGTKDDPSLLVKGQIGPCRARFEALVGEPTDDERPLRVLAFGRRESLNAFCRRAVLYNGNHDGVFIPWSTRTIALTTEFAPYRLTERERIVRLLLAYDLLHSFASGRTPMWMQVGVASVVASGGDPDEQIRLSRRMLASIARGTDLDAASLFRPASRTLIRHMTRWQEHAHFAAYTQYLGQLSSVGDYLVGHAAPADRRERLRQFLKDLDPKTQMEETFERHFGHGLDELLVRWRAWVKEQGAGTHEPPPAAIHDAIVERVVPLITSKNADLLERIQAIRELGKAGFLVGAETLIERLESDRTLPREELVWSLEAISGVALGDDAGRWRTWWEALPAEATAVAQTAAPRPLATARSLARSSSSGLLMD